MAETTPVSVTFETARTPGVEVGGESAGIRTDNRLDLGSIDLE